MKNINGGGAQTNANGLKFEQETKLNDTLTKKGFIVTEEGEIYKKGTMIGYSASQTKFRKLIKSKYNHDILDNVSIEMRPDDAFINLKNNTCYIIEKKFQTTSGSVDEKIQTAPFKLKQYRKMLEPIGMKVEYCYVMNRDWFGKDRYKDVLEYIKECGAGYFFDSLPLSYLNL